MRFSITQLLLLTALLAVAFAMSHNPSWLAIISVAALYSLIFANSFGRKSFEHYGSFGAIVGWLLPLLIILGTEHFQYFTGTGSPPYFDGDGLLWGGLIAPMIWLLYTILPVVIMGWVIGYCSRIFHTRFIARPSRPQLSK